MDVTTLNVFVSALTGFLAGLIMTPVNALFTSKLKKDEQEFQHRLDVIAKQRELFLEHRLEMKRQEYEQKIEAVDESKQVKPLAQKMSELEGIIQKLISRDESLVQDGKQLSSMDKQLRSELTKLEQEIKALDEKVHLALFVNARVELLEKRVFTSG